ncbi:MAG: PepSY-associated TM helix domain-containing protein [Saprospiraceae bacterium]|nr:PepSY-associated TM helix domain-containing protein [Saprospiraceae bacterium]
MEEQEPKKEAYALNPYDASLIGRWNLERDFMWYVEDMHKTLFLGEVGKWIIAANVVIFLTMLLTGLYLWFPRKKNQRKTAFNLNLTGKWQLVNYSLHNTLGFYFLLPLFLIALTGIWWAVKPVQKGVYAALGEKMMEKKKKQSVFEENKVFTPQNAFQAVNDKYVGWNEAHINFAKNDKDIIKVNLKYPYAVYKKSNVFEFDQYSGKIIHTELYADYKTGDKIKHANRDLHTGQNYGIVGKLIAFFASLFAATLPITGFMIWYHRKYKKSKKATIVRPVIVNNPQLAMP